MLEKEFFPLSVRLQIPAGTLPGAPHQVECRPGVDHLGKITFEVPTTGAGIAQEIGVKILSNGLQIYPALGSGADATAALATIMDYGHLPAAGNLLPIEFNKKLRGSQNTLHFDFVNLGANPAAVNILIEAYSEVRQKVAEEKRVEASK